jgi:deoxycytidine triphosphate deaminase
MAGKWFAERWESMKHARNERVEERTESNGQAAPPEAGEPANRPEEEPLAEEPVTAAGPPARAQLEALDRDEAKAPIDPNTWDLPPEDGDMPPAFWDDPEPGFHGMLSADRIRAYHYAAGRIIRPFQEENLKPASYELTLGPRYVVNGEVRTLSDDFPTLTIEANSIVFVSMREVLLLPHWLVARFDLSIALIYEGLLLGTGPQVDPGFKGVLSCPLHNISSQPIRLEYKKPFAKMDFVKTSFGQVSELGTVGSERELYDKVALEELTGFQGEQLKLWPPDKNFRRPIFFASRALEVSSSVRELDQRVSTAEDTVARIRRLNVGGALAVLALLSALFVGTIAFGTYLQGYINDRTDDVSHETNAAQLRSDIAALKSTLTAETTARARDHRALLRLERQSPGTSP